MIKKGKKQQLMKKMKKSRKKLKKIKLRKANFFLIISGKNQDLNQRQN